MTYAATMPLASEPSDTRRPYVNALTIDVEDYFHVSGFEGCVSRSQWAGFESRVEMSTRRLLDRLNGASTQATFFVLGWVAERQPRPGAGHRGGRPRDRLPQLLAPADLHADAGRVPRRPSPRPEGAGRHSRPAGRRPTGRRASRSRATACGPWTFWSRKGSVSTPASTRRTTTATASRVPRWGRTASTCRPALCGSFRLRCGDVLGYPLPVGGGGYFRLYPYGLTRRWACGPSTTAAGRSPPTCTRGKSTPTSRASTPAARAPSGTT